ncbi:MAG TPA: Holliday junction resolvase RuvX [Casimicrobiaceae bacterium]|nr:Holliday junction resolvase RuvX [Casimicrobiaceae bacterium]
MTLLPDATVIAFDFGTRRIGVAIGNTLVKVAHPLVTIEGDSIATALAAIGVLIDEWRPQQLVVGLPTHADGTSHAMTAQTNAFIAALSARFRLPVAMVDERWTTEVAQDALDAGRRGRRGRAERDQIAAQIILQAWFDERAGHT